MSKVFNEIDGLVYNGGCVDSVGFLLLHADQPFIQQKGQELCEQLFPETTIGAITTEPENSLATFLGRSSDLSNFWLGLTVSPEVEFIDSSLNLIEDSFFANTSDVPWIKDTNFSINNGGVVFLRGNILGWEVRDSTLERADGVLCRDNKGTLCYDDEDGTSIDLIVGSNSETIYFVPFPNEKVSFDDGIEVCDKLNEDNNETYVVSELRSIDEFVSLSQVLFFENIELGASEFKSFKDKDRAYWLGITLEANLTNFIDDTELTNPQDVYTFNNNVSFDNLEVEFLTEFQDFPWFETQPNFDQDSNITYGVALTRSNGRVLLRLYPVDTSSSDISGVICRPLFVDLDDDDDDFDEDAIIEILIFGGSIFLTTCICFVIVLYKLYYVHKENQKLKKFVKNEKKELFPNMTEITCKNIDNMTDDNYSIVSGISELQRRRSLGDNSINTLPSKRSQISASEKAHDLKIKSILSNRSELTEISRRLLNVSPFIEDIKNTSELLKFYQKVADFLENKIKEDQERECEDETFKAFNIDDIPQVGLSFYIKRLVNGLNLWFNDEHIGEIDEFVGVRALLLAIHLIRKANVDHPLTECNIHKLLCTTILVAVKFIEDEVITNDFWADIAGIMPSEVNRLEEIFCFALNFNFEIDEEEINFSLTKFRL